MLFLLVAWLMVQGQPTKSPAVRPWLTPEEVTKLSYDPDDPDFRKPSLVRGETGPIITLKVPKNGSLVRPPVVVDVSFAPRGAAVSLKTLKVSIHKTKLGVPFHKDITDIVRDTIAATRGAVLTPERLYIPNAPVPPGAYRFQIAITDVDGHQAEEEFGILIGK